MVIRPEKADQLALTLQSAPLVLYGMGGAGLRIAKWCDENRISYVFADKNAETKQRETDKTVIHPRQLAEQCRDANIVIASIIYFEEIRRELAQMGIPDERLLSYKLFMPDHILWADLDGNIDWDLMRFRVEMFSEWIPEDVRSVVDYGAGKMYLQEYLVDHFSDIDGRRASAYVSDLSEKQIVDRMSSNGFRLEKKVPDPVNHACMVYLFRNEACND